MTSIRISAGGERAQLDLVPSVLSPRVLAATPTTATLALVATTALLLGGDHVRITVDVGPGCHLELVDVAGTVAYDGKGAPATWTLNLSVADHAALTWNAEPMIVADGADVIRTTSVSLAGTGTACLRETLILGRTDERGGAVSSHTRVTHGGRPLLVEDVDLTDRARRGRPGILGDHRVIDTLSLLGRRAGDTPAHLAATRYELAGPGTCYRYLGREAHRSAIPAVFEQFALINRQ